MKLRNPLLIKIAAWVLTWVIRLWIGSLRLTTRVRREPTDPTNTSCVGPFLYCTWHETSLLAAHRHGRCGGTIMISRSADGELISQVLVRLGWRLVRGSSSNGAVAASRAIVELSRSNARNHVALTVDGPRGPRRMAKDGVISLAQRTGLPLIPTGFAFHRPWRASSWDRFVLPRPFSRACIIYGDPIHVPVDATVEEKIRLRDQLQETLLDLETEAYALLSISQPPEARYRHPPTVTGGDTISSVPQAA